MRISALIIGFGVLASGCMAQGIEDVDTGSGGVWGGGGTITGSGGKIGSGGTTAGSGGAVTGSGGRIGSGGTVTGSGGKIGSGGAVTGSGGSITGSGGAVTGSGGAVTGSGGSTSGTCSSAFFSSTAAGRKSTEYQSWKTKFVQACSNGKGSGSSVVVKDGSAVVSEGIGYGMLLAANNDDQALLGRLWQYYQDHLDPKGLMNWSTGVCEAPGNNNANAATDGDLDVAMALLVADKKWGGYKTQAVSLIGKIKQYETEACSNGLTVLKPGDVWGGCSDRINPSYFAPGYYRVFAAVDTANAAFWTKLAADSYTLLAQYQVAMGNNLVPDWGTAAGGTANGSGYYYDACRTPWRVATDYLWFCTAAAKTFLQKISGYVDGRGGIASVPFDKNSAFLGAFADSGIAISQSKIDTYVTSWLATGMDDNPYFQGTLRPLYLLVAGGQFASGQ